jgi:arylsulfatase A-like enzyme
MKKVVLWMSLCGLLLVGAACKERHLSDAPNLLLITIDTARADYFGCYGSPDVTTPHIDRLAADGVLFERNVAPSQCTNPAHASIFTGLYLSRHRVVDNRTPMPEAALTLAEILQKKGYATLAAVSAHHLNPQNSRFDQGFDLFLACEPNQINAAVRNETFLAELGRITGRSFFAWVHYFDPHGDYVPPPPYDGMYPVGSDYEPVPPHPEMNLSKEKKSAPVDPDRIIPLYKGEISFVDDQVGRLIRFLKERKVYEKTLIVLVADHGESMTEHGIYFCHAGMYNPVLHVPLIMSMPGRLPRGLRLEGVTSSVDIFPTVLRILELSHPARPIDGKNLTPMFSNPRYRNHEYVISEAVNGVIRAVYRDGYKFMKPYPTDWALKQSRLYRAWDDYGESCDLKDQEPARARQLEAALEEWLKRAKSMALPTGQSRNLDPKTRKALKTLGYID